MTANLYHTDWLSNDFIRNLERIMEESKSNGEVELHSNCRDLFSSLKKNSIIPSENQIKANSQTSVESKYFLKFY